MISSRITIMGIFVADLTFRTPRLPVWGETVLGSDFRMGPGGKGSNQAVAAARLGAQVTFISKVGRDAFGDLARRTCAEEGIDAQFLFASEDAGTGAASIVVHEGKGENAIVVVPGACNQLTAEEIDRARNRIAESAVFLTQLEQPVALAEHALRLARSLGVTTILNPAPATTLPASVYALCDYLTPNESEASLLTGLPVESLNQAQAERAADALLNRGVRNVIVTLGERGALVRNEEITTLVDAVHAGPVIETTGAGDAFAGGLAVALAEGRDIVQATRFACAVAGISVTRTGTATSMPKRDDVDRLFTHA
jgi:ribokinase